MVTHAITQHRRHQGPPLLVLGTVFIALFLGSLVIGGLFTQNVFATPFGPSQPVQAGEQAAVSGIAFLQFGASIPLLLFSATVSSRLHHLGIRAAGATIALVGGVLSAVFLGLSALFTWLLSRPETLGQPVLDRVIRDLAFLTGGPAHVAGFGLLVAGVSITGGFARLLPRWVVWLGVAIAVIAEFSTLSLAFPVIAFLLPLARFPGLVWLIAAAALLPVSRKQVARRKDVAPVAT